jgi:predicted negative regulator of RcsB-dependent stress response
LQRAIVLTPASIQGPGLVQLARAAGDLGNPLLLDDAVTQAGRSAAASSPDAVASDFALHEVQLRGLVHTGRAHRAIALLDRTPSANSPLVPPQWQAIIQVTTGEVLLRCHDDRHARTAFHRAISVAEGYRLPHQIQRVIRAVGSNRRLEDVTLAARSALERLQVALPGR